MALWPGIFTSLGVATLLLAFILLTGFWLFRLSQSVVQGINHYFSAHQRALRQFWHSQAKHAQLISLFHFKTEYLQYRNELQRTRLSKRNTRKHLRSLSKTIEKDLSARKNYYSKTVYQQLRHDYLRYKKRQDIQALLTLQQKISAQNS